MELRHARYLRSLRRHVDVTSCAAGFGMERVTAQRGRCLACARPAEAVQAPADHGIEVSGSLESGLANEGLDIDKAGCWRLVLHVDLRWDLVGSTYDMTCPARQRWLSRVCPNCVSGLVVCNANAVRERNDLTPARHAQLGHDVRHVVADRLLAQEELIGDVGVAGTR